MQSTVQSPLHVASHCRTVGNALLAALITFGLFVVMAKLIEQDGELPIITEPTVLKDVFLNVEEPVTNTKQPVKPMEKTLQPPPSLPVIVESDPGPNDISMHVSPVLPGNDIHINTSIGQNSSATARPIVRVNPSYPADAARNGIEGWVQLTFDLTAQGTVTNIQIVDAEPARVFDREAKRALAKWRYQPQLEKGVPISQSGLQIVLTFTLEQ